jgi:alpha-beta hydrolase superfamily lysophospholipase
MRDLTFLVAVFLIRMVIFDPAFCASEAVSVEEINRDEVIANSGSECPQEDTQTMNQKTVGSCSYDVEQHWRNYQAFFPESFRIPNPNPLPQEEWWQWKEHNVHLDRIDTNESKIKIILLHGVGGYGRLLSPIAVSLSKFGYSIVSPDLPGYGLTRNPEKIVEYRDWIECVSALIDAEVARDGKPVVLFGLSVGGMLAYQSASKNSKVIAVIATCLLDLRDKNIRSVVSRFSFLSTFCVNILERFPGFFDSIYLPMRLITKMNRMSNNSNFNKIVLRDPMGGANWVSARFLRTLLSEDPGLEPENFRIPFMLVHPDADQWTPTELSLPFFERIGGYKELKLLENCGHAPIEEPGIEQLKESVQGFLDHVYEGVSSLMN